MNCPNDNSTLLITDRNGIEIDYCPTCRGVWLDRGELDKLIERAGHPQIPTYHDNNQVRHEQSRSHSEYDRENRHDYRSPHHDNNQYDSHHQDHHKKHKRENFLEDFFDFG